MERARRAAAKPVAAKPAPASDVDAYLARLPPGQRAGLAKVRRAIKAAAPDAKESISYGMPSYKLDGKALIYFAAAKDHLALYATSKGTVRFTPEDPLPAATVTRMVKENAARIRAASRG